MTYDETFVHLAELSRCLAAERDFNRLLQQIVELGAEEIDRCDGVSLLLLGPGGAISTPVYFSNTARDNDLAQLGTDEGPCLAAIRGHETMIIDDMEGDVRWSHYRQRALELGVRSMMGARLFVARDTLGCLNFHSRSPDAFDRRAQLHARAFASHAAVALKAALTEAGLQAALRTRDVIGQAKGILMERHGLTGQGAFERLRSQSQDRNRPLRELAAELAHAGELSAGRGRPGGHGARRRLTGCPPGADNDPAIPGPGHG